jgi:acid phosphatase
MKNIKKPLQFGVIFSLTISLFSCRKDDQLNLKHDFQVNNTVALAVTQRLTHPDHIIFVWFENKGYNKIIGSSSAPYINSLIARGTLFTNTYAITHPSYPNYIAFFSGNTQGVINDNCINLTLLETPNLYVKLKKAGKTFAWYSEGLPATGSTVCVSGDYVEKHNPTTIFANVPIWRNKRFSDFPTHFNKLENVVCITPDMKNDMHDGTISTGDSWLKNKLSSLIDWCTTHNSIFVVYFDEDDYSASNRIPVIAVGQNVKRNFQLDTYYNHYNWTKTICSMFYAPNDWTSNLSSKTNIIGCWKWR